MTLHMLKKNSIMTSLKHQLERILFQKTLYMKIPILNCEYNIQNKYIGNYKTIIRLKSKIK